METNQKFISKKKKIIFPLIIVLVLISGILLGKVFFGGFLFKKDNNSSGDINKIQQQQNISTDRQTSITKAVEKVSPSIVGINIEEVQEYRDPFSDDPFFRQFFGDQLPQNQKQVVRGLGSGFIVSEDGYILTNDHVAGNATKISVTLTTGETVEAKLIGSDKATDVAILKINKSNLPFVAIGNSDNVIIGEWAIALGNPFGLFEINDKPTVTVGVISAKDMKVNAEANRVYKEMIQTDASINRGNSGGPLVNADGEVIGMNTIIYTGGNYNSGSIGVGFAISINRVIKIMEELKSNGKIDRNFEAGFRIQAVDEQMAQYYNLKNKNGVIVTQVLKGSNADKAGLKPEDIIIEANNEKVRNDQDIIFIVQDMRSGDILKLKAIRKGSEENIEFKLEKK